MWMWSFEPINISDDFHILPKHIRCLSDKLLFGFVMFLGARSLFANIIHVFSKTTPVSPDIIQ